MKNINDYPNMSDPIVLEAMNFMIDAHRNYAKSPDPVLGGHRRKYSKAHYEVHPIQVAKMVSLSRDNSAINIACALLHDVVEDTMKTLGDIREHFGKIWGDEVGAAIAYGVSQVTDVSRPEDGNRAFRKNLDKEHYWRATPELMTVKLADFKSNLPSIVRNDPGFARKWVAEKVDIMPGLKAGDPDLWADVDAMIQRYYQKLDCQVPEWELV
jgi:(p)ppGpp synthase/HD superfamily hydrolase